MEKEIDYLRYHSFLNAVSGEFERNVSGKDPKTQKQMLSLAIRIIDAFAEIYGDHDLKTASNRTSVRLAVQEIIEN